MESVTGYNSRNMSRTAPQIPPVTSATPSQHTMACLVASGDWFGVARISSRICRGDAEILLGQVIS